MNAGAEFFQCLDAVLKNHGIEPDYAASVVCVVAAACIKGEATSVGQIVDGALSCVEAWRKDAGSGTLLDIRFDPPYRKAN